MPNQTNASPEALPSALNWFEIPVSNIPRAISLYSAMLDTKLSPMAAGPNEMVLLGSNGCLISSATGKSPQGGTVVYLNARDGVKACLARAVEAGAKVVVPETSIAPHGTMAKIEDLDGNVVGLHAEPGK